MQLMDPLSDVLSLLNARSSHFAGLKAGGDWSIRFLPSDGVKFNAVVDGACWLWVEGAKAPLRLRQGDCFLLTQPQVFTLSSDPQLPAVDAGAVFLDAPNGIAQHGDTDDTFLVGGRFSFDGEVRLLLDSLPPVLLVEGASEAAAVLRWALQRLAQELSAPSPGAALMTQQLGQMMLVQALRAYLAAPHEPAAGWLFALADPRLHAALAAIHAAPARRWTVQQLAALAGVSRSTLALHFKQRVGLGPLEYVLRWRMQLAARALRSHGGSIAAIAESLGYDSDSAFSSAFKRVMACSPSQYRHGRAAP